jgi:hypothetical protein
MICSGERLVLYYSLYSGVFSGRFVLAASVVEFGDGEARAETQAENFCPLSQAWKWQKELQKHTTGGIPRWSPTLVLVARFSAYVWQSGRDAQFSLTYGRMYYSEWFQLL